MTLRKCVPLDDSSIASGFFQSFDYVLTDCDGVLWLGNRAIPGSAEAIKTLQKMGKHVIYVTNNCSHAREDHLKKCERLGFPATVNSIISTSFCAAQYLVSKNFRKKVYILGSEGIKKELNKVNIECFGDGPDPIPENWIQWIDDLKLDPDVGAVIVGFDHNISYPKLTKAANYLNSPDTFFLASNMDEKYPTQGSLKIPGTGSFVYALEKVSGRTATSCGKPERFILDCIKGTYPEIDFSRCIMIGDRLNSDILLGTRNGLKTLFVGTGINSIEDVKILEKSNILEDQMLVPDYYLPCLGELIKLIKS